MTGATSRDARRARRRFTKLVRKEDVVACIDCGLRLPDASLAFAKLYALAEALVWRPASRGVDNKGPRYKNR